MVKKEPLIGVLFFYLINNLRRQMLLISEFSVSTFNDLEII